MHLASGRWRAFLIVLLVWAGIYLPSLGRPEFKGEEGRRVLPAITMLETGNWIVPSVAGRDYYNKPPGINWLVALSFMLTGQQSELTARLPSAFFVLMFATLLIWMPPSWLTPAARLISAIVFLTNISVIEKGRLIEIEAVYISLTGIATIWWLNAWSRSDSKWVLWIIPSILLGFGMLVKGPFILIFFYCATIAVLWHARKLLELLTVEHLLGVSIILFMTLGWFYLAYLHTAGSKMTLQMTSQLLIRIIPKTPDVARWGSNVVKAFVNFLPWLLFVPMLWDRQLVPGIGQEHGPLFRGCRLGLVIAFAAINLMPGMQSRYSLPAVPLASVLVGWLLPLHKGFTASDRLWKNTLLICFVVTCLTAIAGLAAVTRTLPAFAVSALTICITIVVFRKHALFQNTLRLSLATALLTVVVMLQYSTFGVSIITANEKRRPEAYAVNRIVPPGKTVYVFRPSNQLNPVLFYVRPPLNYVLDANQIHTQVRYLLLKQMDLEKLKTQDQISNRDPKVLHKFTDKIPDSYRLVELD